MNKSTDKYACEEFKKTYQMYCSFACICLLILNDVSGSAIYFLLQSLLIGREKSGLNFYSIEQKK